MDYGDYPEKLAGISQQEAIEMLTGKTVGYIEFLGTSDRTSSYTYGNAHVTRLYIVCRCTRCGDIRERDITSVCSAIRKEKLHCQRCIHLGPEQDLSGQTFHSLTVIGREGDWKGYKTLWRVRCELCGKESVIDHQHLGKTKSCTCTRTKNLQQGKEFGEQLYADGSCVSSLTNRALNKNNTSGARGVSLTKDRSGNPVYRAYIYFRRKQYSLGLHTSLESAIAARQEAEQEIYGDYLAWYAENYPEQWKRYTKENHND